MIDRIGLWYNVLEKGQEQKADGRKEWKATKVKVEKVQRPEDSLGKVR